MINKSGVREISGFSRMEIAYMRRFFDSAGSPGCSRITPPAMLPSGHVDGVGSPIALISRLNSPASTHPCQRFAVALTGANTDSGPSSIATPSMLDFFLPFPSRCILRSNIPRCSWIPPAPR